MQTLKISVPDSISTFLNYKSNAPSRHIALVSERVPSIGHEALYKALQVKRKKYALLMIVSLIIISLMKFDAFIHMLLLALLFFHFLN